MNDDKDFIDLDSTQNWSQLDVKKELDNLEVNKETGEKYDFGRGFGADADKKKEEEILLDGLTSGLNYIPEEFLAAADQKHEEDRINGRNPEGVDVSWAYRQEKENLEDTAAFIPIADIKKAEDEAARLRAAEVTAVTEKEARERAAAESEFGEGARDIESVADGEGAQKAEASKEQTSEGLDFGKESDEIEEIRKKNLEAQIAKHAQINASDAAIAANIEARKKAREEAAATQEAIIRENARKREEEKQRAREELQAQATSSMFSNDLDLDELDIPVVTKEERIAAANKNRQLEDDEDVEIVESEEENAEEAEPVRKSGKASKASKAAAAATVAGVKKKKKRSAAEEYASWADEDSETRYEDNDEDEDDDEEYDGEGFFGKIAAYFRNMSGLDILVAGTGVLVVVVAIVTAMVYSSSQATKKKIAEFAPLGANMQTIGDLGSNQFLAIADARNTISDEVEELDPIDEEPTEYVEKDDETNISVTMSLTSVKKDLKIKFINAKTKKLVANHEFKVNIEDAKGKKYSATDDDMDGIIYLNSVTPGEAKVSMADMPGEKGITYSKETVKINIKEKLDYKKIDVSDEIKSENEINAKKEDTAEQLATEGTLADTVEWVESTVTDLDGGYVKLDKKKSSDIIAPDKQVLTPAVSPIGSARLMGVTPMTISQKYLASNRILLLADNEGPSPSPSPGGEPSPSPSPEGDPSPSPSPEGEPSPSPSPEGEPSPSPSPEGDPTPTPTPTPTAIPTPSPTLTPTPTPADVKNDHTTLLKNKLGQQIYVKKDDGTFREATYADYYDDKVKEFYRKAGENENKKYTGWQYINGNTYFYDKNGNPVKGEQVIQGAKYNFDSDGALVKSSGTFGIDVSKWNGNINWTAVKNSGVSFVIIRCGYRGSSTGALVEDPTFKKNIKGATDAGLKVGVYFFSQAVTDVEAVEEASMTIDLIKKYKISYPVFLDVEGSNGRGDKIDSNTRTAVIQAYCQTLKNSGYTPGVYANKSWLSGKMNAGSLSAYKIWLAQYNTEITYTGKVDMWQYSSKGSIGGIGGNTDLDISYLGY